MIRQTLLLPHLRVHNANALSSPLTTIGFPAMTAWLGAAHALQRLLNKRLAWADNVRFSGVGVVSHQFDLQTYKGPGDFEYSIIGTANPVDKSGARPAFIEEARCHLDVSLVIECSDIEKQHEDEIIEQVSHLLHSQMKIAGGDIEQFDTPRFYRNFDLLKNHLMPGYALRERRDLMIDAMQQGQDALDALIDYLAVHHHCETQQETDKITTQWHSQRKRTGPDDQRGWIVPIATGFHGISELGNAKNQRDADTLHRFAESVITLGEFVMPYKLNSFDQLIWRYYYDPENNLYLCQQQAFTDQSHSETEKGF